MRRHATCADARRRSAVAISPPDSAALDSAFDWLNGYGALIAAITSTENVSKLIVSRDRTTVHLWVLTGELRLDDNERLFEFFGELHISAADPFDLEMH